MPLLATPPATARGVAVWQRLHKFGLMLFIASGLALSATPIAQGASGALTQQQSKSAKKAKHATTALEKGKKAKKIKKGKKTAKASRAPRSIDDASLSKRCAKNVLKGEPVTAECLDINKSKHTKTTPALPAKPLVPVAVASNTSASQPSSCSPSLPAQNQCATSSDIEALRLTLEQLKQAISK